MLVVDLICNMFYFFSLIMFFSNYCTLKNTGTTKMLHCAYLLQLIVFSFLPFFPYSSILSFVIDSIYIFLITSDQTRKKIKYLLIFYVYYYVFSFFIFCLHTFIAQDFTVYSSDIYFSYKSIICSALMYIVLSMYFITKKIAAFPSGQIYKRYFLIIMCISTISLTVCSMLFGSTLIVQEQIVPLIFSLILLITILFLMIYRKLVDVLEESSLHKIEAEKNALQQDYYAHVNANLETLSLLRHDFKNHLTILDGYAAQGNCDKIIAYIQSLQGTLNPTKLVQTPSPLLSSLLNAKNEDCKNKNVSFILEQNFPFLTIDDYHLVTILSNLLDNAIAAASRCTNGTVTLRLTQLASFLEIECVNDHQEKLIIKGERFLTTKTTQKEIHGLGITSMRKAVDSLHGKMDIRYTDQLFHVTISVPNYI